MKCLLWETSSVPWGVGIAEFDGAKSTLLAHFEDDGARTLARRLIPSVDDVLREAQCALSDIEACAVSLGPGSWTGLRIGLTAAKTIAQSLNLPIVGIATFSVFAEALHEHACHSEGAVATEESPEVATPHLLLIQAPCRPGELYAKLWHCRGAERDLLEAEWIGTYAQINNRLEFWMKDLNVSTVVANAPEPKIKEPLQQAISAPVEWRESTFSRCLQAFGKLAALQLQNEPHRDVLKIQPIYLAPSAAEREYYAKHHRE
jgi:tRNA threonylcarbamoyl adenosine modification protein YeaZ